MIEAMLDPPSDAANPDDQDQDASRTRVLVVDDEPMLRRVLQRRLTQWGHLVDQAGDAEEATRLIGAHEYDAILSDIAMPGRDGIALLASVREHQLDVPIILITGSPSLESAIRAVELGAFHYLTKPIDSAELERVLTRAVRLSRISRLKRQAMKIAGVRGTYGSDSAGLRATFDAALASLAMAYQPIVTSATGEIFGYEALMRPDAAFLPHPLAMLRAAEQLDQLTELGRIVRQRAAVPMLDDPARGVLFVNLHPIELLDRSLVEEGSPLALMADRVVLEITERVSLDHITDLRARVRQLRGMGFRIAIDDLGSGYSGLSSFAVLQPEIVKIDMKLVRGIDRDPMKQRLIRSITELCKDMGMMVVAEGVETPGEREAVVGLGCDMMQGFLLARPAAAFPGIAW
jgi:EAL domain-containing protein (putative c-di-GMP-specific phosphodiesterase class I)